MYSLLLLDNAKFLGRPGLKYTKEGHFTVTVPVPFCDQIFSKPDDGLIGSPTEEQIPLGRQWGLCEYVIVHTVLGGSPVILWISLGGKPKWLPLKFGYHDVMRTSPIMHTRHGRQASGHIWSCSMTKFSLTSSLALHSTTEFFRESTHGHQQVCFGRTFRPSELFFFQRSFLLHTALRPENSGLLRVTSFQAETPYGIRTIAGGRRTLLLLAWESFSWSLCCNLLAWKPARMFVNKLGLLQRQCVVRLPRDKPSDGDDSELCRIRFLRKWALEDRSQVE